MTINRFTPSIGVTAAAIPRITRRGCAIPDFQSLRRATALRAIALGRERHGAQFVRYFKSLRICLSEKRNSCYSSLIDPAALGPQPWRRPATNPPPPNGRRRRSRRGAAPRATAERKQRILERLTMGASAANIANVEKITIRRANALCRNRRPSKRRGKFSPAQDLERMRNAERNAPTASSDRSPFPPRRSTRGVRRAATGRRGAGRRDGPARRRERRTARGGTPLRRRRETRAA